MDGAAADDVVVTLLHPHGSIDVTLVEWIATGPGARDRVRPVAARDRKSGRQLPLTVIPLRYRNTALSRVLIRLRLLADPWPSAG
jgi:hypothetical protein